MIDFNDKTICDSKGSLLTHRTNDEIDSYNTDFRMIIGQRSNGKTYPTITFNGIKRFLDSDGADAFAYIRRYPDHLRRVRKDLFNGPVENGWLEWYSKGKWNNIYYYQDRWYLRKIDSNGKIIKKCDKPLCYAFAISEAEKYKGPDYPMIKTIILDEFISEKGRYGYVPAELYLWKSLLSTIIRRRTDVVVYMIANTISKNCPYLDKYKIDVDQLEQGTIEVRNYKSGGTLAVEYCKATGSTEISSTKYFDIDDEGDDMIVKGLWETSDYPKLPSMYHKYKHRVLKSFFIVRNNGKIIQGDFITTDEKVMIYFHIKTTPIRKKQDYVYLEKVNNSLLHKYQTRVGFKSCYKMDVLIIQKIQYEECYYQNNDVGESVKYFLENT